MTMTADRPRWLDLDRSERIDIVKPLWDDGKSAGEIAFYFIGATRNAIIGLVHRNKWQRAPSVNKASIDRANQRKRKATPNPVKRPVGRPRAPEIVAPAPERIDWINQERPPLAGTIPVSMLALPMREGGLCRFPVLGGYCGIECGDDMYCQDHHRYMYQPQRERE